MAKNNIPRHIGFIPDGNRRWVVDHGLPKETGYAHGINPGLLLFEKCKECGIKGSGEAVLDGVRTAIQAGFAVVVPSGVNHNIINTGNVPLKLYTLYAPPNHRDGVVHHTRADAEADNEHFDGKTTE
jgi:hypothetical protein